MRNPLLASSALFVVLATAACSGAEGGGEASVPFSPHPAQAGDGPSDAALFETEGDEDVALPTAGCTGGCPVGSHCSVSGACIPEGTCVGDADCGDGLHCESGKCVAGGGCGSESAEPTVVPPNLMIVLDRSCSMQATVGGGTKWSVAIGAIQKMLATYKGKIRFGITLFPDRTGDKCTQDAIPVDIGDTSTDAIASLLAGALSTSNPLYPSGPCITNIDTGVQQAAKEPAFTDTTRTSSMLLITDGSQVVCNAGGGNTGTEATLADLTKKGIRTYVIGYGTDIEGTDSSALNSFALYGGTALTTGPTKYYPATDGSALDAALGTIAASSLSCTFALSKKPLDAEKIYAFFDHTVPVPRDPSNGWTYDPTTNSVTFVGSACKEIQDQTVKRVDIVFGCNQPLPK